MLQAAYESNGTRASNERKKAAFTLIITFVFVLFLALEINVFRWLFSIESAFMNSQIDNVSLHDI